MKRIAALTTFYNWDRAYSLTSVVEEQLKALKEGGHEPILFVHDNFKADSEIPEGIEIRKVVPRFSLVDYSHGQPVPPGFDEQVKKVKEALLQHLQDIDVAFTHDWIFTGWNLPYNVGMRQAEPYLKTRWFHWVHSAPSLRPTNLQYPHDCRFKTMPKSKLIYMNNYDALRLAEMYGGTLDDVRIVYNPLDFRSYPEWHELTKGLIEKHKLYEADIIAVYPISMTRAMGGKQPDKIIWLMGKLKENGKKVKLIICNAHSNNEKEKRMVYKYLDYAKQCGLNDELIFTSQWENKNADEFYLYKCPNCEYEYGQEKNGEITWKHKETEFTCDKCKAKINVNELRKIDRSPVPRYPYELGVPKQVVRELMQISNLFVFPTLSENCPLILLEAAASKSLLVLNKSFEPLREFFGENALYFEFGALGKNVKYDDEEKYYDDMAKIIIAELKNNKPLNAFNTLRQKFNYSWIYKNQIEPMLYENYARV